MANSWLNSASAGRIGPGVSTGNTGSAAMLAINSAWTQGSAGAGVAIRFTAQDNDTISGVWVFLVSATGTGGTLQADVRNLGASSTAVGSTVLGTSTSGAVGTTANKWIYLTFGTPVSVTKNTVYWIVLYNIDGSPTSNYPTLRTALNVNTAGVSQAGFGTYTTANGTSSLTGANNFSTPFVIKYGSGKVWGNPWTTTTNLSTSQLRRGVYLSGLTAPASLAQIGLESATNISAVSIYGGSQIPTDTPLYTMTVSASSRQSFGIWLDPEFVLAAGTAYRIIFTFSANSTSPAYLVSEDSATPSDVLACGVGGGAMYWTQANAGSTGWDDFPERFPRLQLAFSDQVAASGGYSRARTQ